MGSGTKEVAMAPQTQRRAAKEVVVGIDDSSQSVAALRWAAAYAKGAGAVLRLLHVWDLSEAELYSVAALPEAVAEDARLRLTRLVVDVLGAPAERNGWHLEVLRGPVGPTLVRAAESAELLVVGTGGHTGLRRIAAGSVSHYCLAHAGCPIVAVPGRLPAAGRSPS